MLTIKKNRAFLCGALLLTMLCIAVFSIKVSAISQTLIDRYNKCIDMDNGYHLQVHHYNSGRLIIGDSRTCQLWKLYHNDASFASVWGGNYGFGGKKMQIDDLAKRKIMKSYVINTIKKKGYCKVFLFATVNGYDGVGAYTGEVDKLIHLANRIYGWTATYKGKKIHPRIYVWGLVGSQDVNVYKYNCLLKKKCNSTYKIKQYINTCKYIDPKSVYCTCKSGYLEDKVHYSIETLYRLWKGIRAK